MNSPDLISVPGQLGPYRLLRRLGYGGTSQVFLAECYGASGFTKRVAIKTLLPQLIGDPDHERLFIREATLGANLFHRNLVQIHDFGVSDGVQYMRLDYVDGETFAEQRGDAAMPADDVLHVVREVAAALQYLHDATGSDGRRLGLVHRDIKPSNVLISHHGEVRLGDLGILKATEAADFTRGGMRRGSYAYMSPEQVAAEPLGPASDQFSWGTMALEAVTGAHPFAAESVSAVLDRIQVAEPDGLSNVANEAFRNIIKRALNRDPEQRFPNASALLEALHGVNIASTI